MSEGPPVIKNTPSIEGKGDKGYPLEFFEVQAAFAKKVAELKKISLAQSLLENTNFFRRFNLGRSFDDTNQVWKDFVSGLGDDVGKRAHDFYLKQKDVKSNSVEKKNFGCFSCEIKPGKDYVRIHFGNREKEGGPLDDSNLNKRLEDLKHMFKYVKINFPDIKKVRGSSWLYNLDNYKRLFPKEYVDSAKVTTTSFSGFSSWGQFLDKNTQIKRDRAAAFLKNISSAKSIEEVQNAFPFKVLDVEADIEYFYNLYGI